MNPSQTSTSVITARQIADLIDRDVTLLSACKDVLPEPTPLHTGHSGRPQLCYSIEDIVEFVMSRTSFMSEIECRLRLALSPEHRRRPKPAAPRIVDRDHGESFVVPSDLTDLTDLSADVRGLLDQAMADDLSRLRTSRINPRNKP